jgi:hypothetical protein
MARTMWHVVGVTGLRYVAGTLRWLSRMACTAVVVVEVHRFLPDATLLTWGLLLCTIWGTLALTYWLMPGPGPVGSCREGLSK